MLQHLPSSLTPYSPPTTRPSWAATAASPTLALSPPRPVDMPPCAWPSRALGPLGQGRGWGEASSRSSLHHEVFPHCRWGTGGGRGGGGNPGGVAV